MVEDIAISTLQFYDYLFNQGGTEAVRTMTTFSPQDTLFGVYYGRPHDAPLEREPQIALSICRQRRVFHDTPCFREWRYVRFRSTCVQRGHAYVHPDNTKFVLVASLKLYDKQVVK